MSILKQDFTGGINRRLGSTKIGPSEYLLGSNIRVRGNTVKPIRKPLKLTGITAQRFHGGYAVDNFLIVAADGFLYWRDMSIEDSAFAFFIQADGTPVQLDATADIHFNAVPASSIDFIRKRGTSVTDPVNYTSTIDGVVPCVIVQNGINTPWILTSDGKAQKAGTYEAWTPDNRSYIPIGLEMYNDGKVLYTISPDRKKLLRSVSGRFTDHVIAIGNDGNKDGDADVTGWSISYAPLLGIGPLYGSEDFFVSAGSEGFKISYNTNLTFWGEYHFNRTPLSTGPLNHYCSLTIGADTVFVDAGGIKSFNAVAAVASKSEVLPFSENIQSLFNNIVQTNPCAVSIRDYSYFSMQTVYGEAIVVYDEQLATFVSIDFNIGLSDVFRLVSVRTAVDQELVVITRTGVYLYESGTETATAGIYIGDFSAEKVTEQVSLKRVSLLFVKTFAKGSVAVKTFLDGDVNKNYTKDLVATATEPDSPLEMPLTVNGKTVKTLHFQYQGDEKLGSHHGIWVTFDVNAEINAIEIEYDLSADKVPANKTGSTS